MFDIKEVEAAAIKELTEARMKKAKAALLAQMQSVEAARDVLRGEERKLDDLKQRIGEGTF